MKNLEFDRGERKKKSLDYFIEIRRENHCSVRDGKQMSLYCNCNWKENSLSSVSDGKQISLYCYGERKGNSVSY